MLRQGIHKDYYMDPEHPEHMAPVFTDRPFTVKIHLRTFLVLAPWTGKGWLTRIRQSTALRFFARTLCAMQT